MKKLTTRDLRARKGQQLQMLTCYDYPTARMLNETSLDMILVGDSAGNVVLGYDTTIPVQLSTMELFGKAVRKGAPDKFVVVDMPFGSYSTKNTGIRNGSLLFQRTEAEAIKLEGAAATDLAIIKRLTETGVAVMGHIGLTPQSVHQMGGYFTHGKIEARAQELREEAMRLQDAGCFSIVLECVEEKLATAITKELSIPTIGIGSGVQTDGQVLVINDLLRLNPDRPPKFVTPIADLWSHKKALVEEYLRGAVSK